MSAVGLYQDHTAAPICGNTPHYTALVGALAATACETKTWTKTGMAAGTFTGWAMADSPCGITEANEGNNTASKSYTVASLPVDAGVQPDTVPTPDSRPRESQVKLDGGKLDTTYTIDVKEVVDQPVTTVDARCRRPTARAATPAAARSTPARRLRAPRTAAVTAAWVSRSRPTASASACSSPWASSHPPSSALALHQPLLEGRGSTLRPSSILPGSLVTSRRAGVVSASHHEQEKCCMTCLRSFVISATAVGVILGMPAVASAAVDLTASITTSVNLSTLEVTYTVTACNAGTTAAGTFTLALYYSLDYEPPCGPAVTDHSWGSPVWPRVLARTRPGP